MDAKINFFCAIAVWKLQITLIACYSTGNMQRETYSTSPNELCKFVVRESETLMAFTRLIMHKNKGSNNENNKIESPITN